MTLLEREATLEAIASATATARRGRGSIMLVEGPAGIGKSAVLAAARGPELRWLRARGGELERDLPLGVTRQLLEPTLADADAAARTRLLAGTGPAGGALEGTDAAERGRGRAVARAVSPGTQPRRRGAACHGSR
jgi:hypothetical protein